MKRLIVNVILIMLVFAAGATGIEDTSPCEGCSESSCGWIPCQMCPARGHHCGGGPFLRYYFFDTSEVSDSLGGSFLVAGGCGWGLMGNDWLRMGGIGGFSVTDLGGPDDENIDQGFGFGGIIVGTYFELGESFALSIPITLGFGSYEFRNLEEELGSDRYTVELYEGSYFALEPGIELLIKLSKKFAISVQGGYQLPFGESLGGDLEFTGGPYLGLGFYFANP